LNVLTVVNTLAQATAPVTTAPAATGGAKPGFVGLLESPMFPLMIGVLVLYFFVFRSKKTQDRKRTDMLSQLKQGDRVQTIGGILGNVVRAEETKVLLKVDESSNTKIWFSRTAIHRVLEEDGKAVETK
jgi:preprotein translocase subunit YajC